MKRSGLFISLLLSAVLIAGCGDAAVQQTPTPEVKEDVAEVDNADVTEEADSDAVEDAAEADDATEVEDVTEVAAADIGPENLDEVVDEGDNKFTCTYDGVPHDFIVDLPAEAEGAPLILVLHGYGGTAENFKNTVHLEKEANEAGYAVVYVTGAADPSDATSSTGWNSGTGDGVNKDVGFLVALAHYLQDEYGFDKEHTYAAGFSNGAFMMHRLAIEAYDTFSGVVSVAGKMPESIWNAKGGNGEVSVFQVSGEKDDVVPKRDANYTKDPAIEDVIEYYASLDGLDEKEETEIGKGSVLTKYTSANNKMQVWQLTVKNGRHSWPDEGIAKINTNSLIIEFFETQK